MSRRRVYSLFFLPIVCMTVATLSLLWSCARMGTPDGGLYDETPPRLVRTSPANGSMREKTKKIVLEFDEIVKLDNAQSVVVSPPQMEQPVVEAYGRKVTVQLQDTLKENMTYTIDFSNSISDNNEGNPFGDYAFTFSTGTVIDTFQVSGYVLDASNLEPVKGMLVGLYSVGENNTVDDSLLYRRPMERISHTDGSGHFVIKGLSKDSTYMVFAVNDQDQDYKLSQKSEMLAFLGQSFKPTCRPDIRQDTVWHDSIHYDSIVQSVYTHFYPDDLTLMAFTEEGQIRYMLKKERLEPRLLTLFFSAPHDSMPRVRGLNFDAADAFIIDSNEGNDTINYWIKDSMIYKLDTLQLCIDYYKTDSTGSAYVLETDTSAVVAKMTYEKMMKNKAEKEEEWKKQYRKENKDVIRDKRKELKEQGVKVKDSDIEIDIPDMPEEFMDVKYSNGSSLDPDKNITLTLPEPIDTVYMDKFHFYMKVDSVKREERFVLKKVDGKLMQYRLYAEWQPDSSYVLEVDTGAFVSIYGNRTDAQKRQVRVGALEKYSSLVIEMRGADPSAVIELLDGSDKVVKTTSMENGKAYFYFVNPGTYYVRTFYDLNKNGKWDTGCYAEGRQAEPMYYMPKALPLKAGWDASESWNPTEREITRQKPEKITKQKPDKEKTIKSRNAEKLAEYARRKRK